MTLEHKEKKLILADYDVWCWLGVHSFTVPCHLSTRDFEQRGQLFTGIAQLVEGKREAKPSLLSLMLSQSAYAPTTHFSLFLNYLLQFRILFYDQKTKVYVYLC